MQAEREKITFYADMFLDESMTYPDKRGNRRHTGKLSGFIFTRTFKRTRNGKIVVERGIVPFSWAEDTQEAKAAAIEKVITGMEVLPGLDENPPLNWIPSFIRKELLNEIPEEAVRKD